MINELFTQELELEESYKAEGQRLLAKSITSNMEGERAADSTTGRRLIEHHFDTVVDNVRIMFEDLARPKRGAKPSYAPIVEDLRNIYAADLNKLYQVVAYTTLGTTLNSIFASLHPISNIAQKLGRDLEEEAQLEKFLQLVDESTTKKVLEGLDLRVGKLYRTYYAMQTMKDKEVEKLNWASADRLRFCTELIENVAKGCGYFTIEPNPTDAKHLMEVQPTQWLLDTWSLNTETIIDHAYKFCPMIIPPKKWEDFNTGCYYGVLSNKATLLRIRQSSNIFVKEHMAKLNQLDLSKVMESINNIQETPWKINTRILETVHRIIDAGGNLAGIPSLNPLPKLPKLVGEYTPEELKEHKKKAVEIVKLDNIRKSKALRALSIFGIAKRYKDFEKVYFPHNMDFRGRVYPLTVLSPQGDDLGKSLLLFADAPALRKISDVDWLLIAGANFAGVDKVSYADRIQWVLDNEDNILASAADPVAYTWWAEVAVNDCPLEFLAFCFELEELRAYEKEHGTPVGFVSGLPVAFDGTCSGLQHFSAILRDPIGGRAVNLLPGDKPNDIYGMVAEKVNEVLFEDAKNGSVDEDLIDDEDKPYTRFGTKSLAQQWISFGSTCYGSTGINRKVTKRSVMTLAYGSKEYGFKDQLLEDIIKPFQDSGDFTFSNKSQAARYMAKLIWVAVGKVVVKAVEGMKWLQTMAKLATKDHHVVSWNTPMGLCVQQSYMKYDIKTIWIRLNNVRFRTYDCTVTGDIDKHHQASGIAPNFIHSMDASHLQLTVNRCKEKGLTHFAMIHDSYGTCASDAETMFKTVREAFVEMYTDNNILETFQEDMQDFIDDVSKMPPIPEKGTLDIKEVLSSPYTFA